jgi:hypothetical protein
MLQFVAYWVNSVVYKALLILILVLRAVSATIFMLNVVVLSAIMLRAVMPNVKKLNVVKTSVAMLGFVM